SRHQLLQVGPDAATGACPTRAAPLGSRARRSAAAQSVPCVAASFHADLGARFHVMLDLLNPAITLQPLAPNRALTAIHTVQLKDVLRKIHTNASKLHFRPLPIRDWNRREETCRRRW